MAAVPYAHIVAQLLEKKHPKGTHIELAPNPKDIVSPLSQFILSVNSQVSQIWDNLNKSPGEIARKQTMGWIWLFLVCFINTVPLFIISILANLSSLTAYVPFLDEWQTASSKSFNVISGVLPSVVSALFGFVLPIVMRWLSRYMGVSTSSKLDRAVLARYFAFLIISQLVVFTLIGVIFSTSWHSSLLPLYTLPDMRFCALYRLCQADRGADRQT